MGTHCAPQARKNNIRQAQPWHTETCHMESHTYAHTIPRNGSFDILTHTFPQGCWQQMQSVSFSWYEPSWLIQSVIHWGLVNPVWDRAQVNATLYCGWGKESDAEVKTPASDWRKRNQIISGVTSSFAHLGFRICQFCTTHTHTHTHTHTVFPTHRLYLGGPPKYIWWHIFIFITIIIIAYTFFYPPEIMKPSAID